MPSLDEFRANAEGGKVPPPSPPAIHHGIDDVSKYNYASFDCGAKARASNSEV